MDNIYSLLNKHGIEAVFLELDKKGYYNPKLKIMFINQSISEEKQKEVIIHELCHALEHKDYHELYSNFSFRSKMEQEATQNMIKYLIKESDGYYNYSNLFESYKLGLGWEDKIN